MCRLPILYTNQDRGMCPLTDNNPCVIGNTSSVVIEPKCDHYYLMQKNRSKNDSYFRIHLFYSFHLNLY